jgi:hypothetical protein
MRFGRLGILLDAHSLSERSEGSRFKHGTISPLAGQLPSVPHEGIEANPMISAGVPGSIAQERDADLSAANRLPADIAEGAANGPTMLPPHPSAKPPRRGVRSLVQPCALFFFNNLSSRIPWSVPGRLLSSRALSLSIRYFFRFYERTKTSQVKKNP